MLQLLRPIRAVWAWFAWLRLKIMANWRALTAMATGTADRLFREPVCLSFLKQGLVDPDRPKLTINAQLHLPEETDGKLGRSASQFHIEVVSGVGVLIIQKADFLDQTLLAGDMVRGLDRAGQPWFEILSVDTRGADQIVAKISLATKAATPV